MPWLLFAAPSQQSQSVSLRASSKLVPTLHSESTSHGPEEGEGVSLGNGMGIAAPCEFVFSQSGIVSRGRGKEEGEKR